MRSRETMGKVIAVALVFGMIMGLGGLIAPSSPVLADAVVTFPDPNLEASIREAIAKPEGDIHRSDLEGLTTLSASNRGISDLTGLEYCINLTWLRLQSNQISDISPLTNLTSLTDLLLGVNQISNISSLAGLTSLTRLFLQWNQISDISPLAGLTSLTMLALSENQISDILPLAKLTNLTYLILSNNKISDISPLEGLTSLTELFLGVNQIGDISSMASLTSLTELSLELNKISDISPLADLTSLKTLYILGNQISDISALEGLTSLTRLNLAYNQISDISPLANLTKLRSLSLGVNEIGDISSLAALTELGLLTLDTNQISDISVLANLTRLSGLHLHTNHISDISPLAGLANLGSLELSGNQISDISPLAGLTSLTMLFLSENQISDILPLAKLTSLTYLYLGDNQISDISPLANLTSLTDLYLFNNQISDISPLAGLTSLTYLYLFNNQISDISPLVDNTGLGQGDTVDLRWNCLDLSPGSEAMAGIQALLDRGVDVRYEPQKDTLKVGHVTLIESLSMTHGPYIVGDTLTASFRVKNIGDAAITLDKLLLGGRYNGGELPGGGFPDFSHQTVTLQPGQTHEYEGTFTIPAPGDYYFFIAYYIENPTEAEKQFLDEHNWNTCIDLGPGLTDADRTRHIVVSYEERVLVEIYGTGSTLALRDEPEGEVLMRLPDGWVLWVEDTHGNSVEQGGHIWWELEDEILNVSGWAAKEFLRIGDQHDLVAKARLLDDLDERRVAFLDAVANYYFGSDGRSCLYAGIDPARNTNLNLLREKGVPIEVIMAIAGQEGAFQYSFDNTIYDQYYATIREDYRTAGVGIMQIHGRIFPDGNKGWGSNLLNYRAYEAGAYPVNGQYHHDYYGNTPQGIHANVKDGFRVMQYGIQMRPQSEDTMENVAKVITAYNTGETYPSRVASRLKQLGEYYGDDYGEQLRGLATEHGYIYAPLTEDEIDDLYDFLTNYERVEANSPVEVMVLDSKGRITGLVDGDVVSDIPYSVQVDMTVVIFNPVDRYSYVIKGTDSGDYDLRIVSFKNGAATAFTAISIPTMGGAIHQYTVDWEALAQGEDGVAVQVDADGDGVFEESFTAGSVLTGDQFILSTETFIDFDPDVLNLRARSGLVTVYIELPEGFDVNEIDVSSIRLNGTLPVLSRPTSIGDYNRNGTPDLMVKFDRRAVQAILEVGQSVEITITGEVGGTPFMGVDTIRVIG